MIVYLLQLREVEYRWNGEYSEQIELWTTQGVFEQEESARRYAENSGYRDKNYRIDCFVVLP